MRKSRILVCLLALIMAVSMAGCNTPKGNGKTEPKGKPDYSEYVGTSVMPLGGWIGSRKFQETTAQYGSEAGLTFFNGFRMSHHFDNMDKCLEWLEKYNMKTFVSMQGVEYPKDIESEYFDSDAIIGLGFWDEPGYDDLKNLSERVSAFRKDHPGYKAFINLFPNYGDLNLALRKSAENGSLPISDEAKEKVKNYADYVNAFADGVDTTQLSVDYYPLIGYNQGYDAEKGQCTFNKASLAQGWLATLEQNALAAKRVNKDLWCCIQTMSFGRDRRAPLSTADITFQNYVSMCYGVKGLQYFCFDTPAYNAGSGGEFDHYDYGMTYSYERGEDNPWGGSDSAQGSNRGGKSNVFEYVKEANAQIKTFQHAFMQFKWENCMPVYGSSTASKNVENQQSFRNLASPLTTSGDFTATADNNALVGVFSDKDGYKGYMLTNFSDPTQNTVCTLTLTVKGQKMLVYANGTETVVDLEDGVYTCELQPGEGRFVIPYSE